MALANPCFFLFRNEGLSKLERQITTEISGPLPEVIQDFPVRRNRNEPFHLNSNRKFRNLWHNGKHHEFPKKGKEPPADCQKCNAECSDRNKWPPPEVIPDIPVRRNWNGPFHLNFDRNFLESLPQGKEPLVSFELIDISIIDPGPLRSWCVKGRANRIHRFLWCTLIWVIIPRERTHHKLW